jgi:hypothetical protein
LLNHALKGFYTCISSLYLSPKLIVDWDEAIESIYID